MFTNKNHEFWNRRWPSTNAKVLWKKIVKPLFLSLSHHVFLVTAHLHNQLPEDSVKQRFWWLAFYVKNDCLLFRKLITSLVANSWVMAHYKTWKYITCTCVKWYPGPLDNLWNCLFPPPFNREYFEAIATCTFTQLPKSLSSCSCFRKDFCPAPHTAYWTLEWAGWSWPHWSIAFSRFHPGLGGHDPSVESFLSHAYARGVKQSVLSFIVCHHHHKNRLIWSTHKYIKFDENLALVCFESIGTAHERHSVYVSHACWPYALRTSNKYMHLDWSVLESSSLIQLRTGLSGLLRKPQLLILQRLVKSLYFALITNYSQLHDREYH